MTTETTSPHVPSILAPADSKASFLAALAAGADAIYCGMKSHSARMGAQNFTLEELSTLTELAHLKGTKVYVTVNTLLTHTNIDDIGDLLKRLNKWVRPDALIFQDLSLIDLFRQTDFTGNLILSTLANVSFPEALTLIRNDLGVDGVVIPRELNIDEIKAMAQACPEDLKLEIFVHGALCYAVSGRCYWSSYLGGKSGLKGRCVQPCRRYYRQHGKTSRGFSCQDLSLDVLTKVLLTIPQIQNWKIEGRKKGPHYVFYTVKAYQLLRDHRQDPKAKKEALMLLERSLGRKGTHYHFLPQRPQGAIDKKGQTGSGLLIGRIQGGEKNRSLIPREDLLPGDRLRIGFEDERWHFVSKVNRYVPQKGRLHLKFSQKNPPPKGIPVFLVDRREKALQEMIESLEKEQRNNPLLPRIRGAFQAELPSRSVKRKSVKELHVYRTSNRPRSDKRMGLWLSGNSIPKGSAKNTWWWLPPVIWPEETTSIISQLQRVINRGSRHFVLNAPWQTGLFNQRKGFTLWAGPFCNISNPLAVTVLAKMGYSGVIVSPELGKDDYLQLPKQSSLPLGVVVSGNWPLCVARISGEVTKLDHPFVSPKGEQAWVSKNDSNYWIYPNWTIDLKKKKNDLKSAGYSLFVILKEPIPRKIEMKKRPGIWNWKLGLK